MADQDPWSIPDDEMGDEDVPVAGRPEILAKLIGDVQERTGSNRLVMAIDFGTTYSAISFVALKPGDSPESILSSNIRSIQNYPDDIHANAGDPMRSEAPTELIYPLDRHFRKKANLDPALDGQADYGEQVEEHNPPQNGDHNDHDQDDVMEVDRNQDVYDLEMIQADTTGFRWGYEVHRAWGFRDTHSDNYIKALSRFKLLLHIDEETQRVRDRLEPTLNTLRMHKVIKKPIVTNGLYDDREVEIVMCVPAIWSPQACRDMQAALSVAIVAANFEGVNIENHSIKNLFVVTEPEAAATYVLGNSRSIRAVELSMRTHTSYLNEAFRDYIRQRLKDEKYLEKDGITIDGIVETIMMNEFEYRCKRSFDITIPNQPYKAFACEGLKEDKSKGFGQNRLYIKAETIRAIFQPCLQGIERLMFSQIEAAEAKGMPVDHVVLIGGFAGVTAVASGAVLRALNKERGPERYARSSYGIIRSEPYKEHEEHELAKATPTMDKCDGELYVNNTIDWVLKLGNVIPPVWQSAELLCRHNIPVHPPTPLICEELLYVSDHATESHYSRLHRKNRGSQLVGRIVANFNFLLDEGLITPTDPPRDSNGRQIGRKHYKVQYSMVIQVVDRDLKCYAVYNGRKITECRINIASGFLPGVK
ncbi:hypothetical protein DL770_007309 [Monosporascus sp. CRB-9-2]|nr:hypothetical protein DL770_007309 [Monosporascus sp. CRB-9-2]